MIVEAFGWVLPTPVEPFNDNSSMESDTDTSSDTEEDMNQINFSTGSISLLIQTVPAVVFMMVFLTIFKPQRGFNTSSG